MGEKEKISFDMENSDITNYFNRIPNRFFVERFNDMADGIGTGGDFGGCTFVGDLDPWEEIFDGVRFEGYESYRIYSFEETLEYMRKAGDAYLKTYPEDGTEINAALAKFKKVFIDKIPDDKIYMYRYPKEREECEGLYKCKHIVHKTVSAIFYSFNDFDDEKIFINLLNTVEKYGDKFLTLNYRYGINRPYYVYEKDKKREIVSEWVKREKHNNDLCFFSEDGKTIRIALENGSGYHNAYLKSVLIEMSINHLNQQDNLKDFLNLCDEVAILFDTVCGKITNEILTHNYLYIERDFKIRYPDLSWKEYFGTPYIDMWGYENLSKAPCYKFEKLNENLVSLQLTENMYDPLPVETKDKIRNHLGIDSFVEEHKIVTNYPYGKAPNFRMYKFGRGRA